MNALSVLHLGLAVLAESVATPLHHERWSLNLVDLHQFLARFGNVVLLGLPVLEPHVEVLHLLKFLNHIYHCVNLYLSALGNLLLDSQCYNRRVDFFILVKCRQHLVLSLKSFNLGVFTVEHLF